MSNTTPFRHGSVLCMSGLQLHRMAYTDWGDPDNPDLVFCVHGLTRNARDFDRLAAALSPRYRVICSDVAGRGLSDWLLDPSGYVVPNYVNHMLTLLARSGAERIHWVGTSMGGLIGMGLAALDQSPIRSLVLNDVGPVLDAPALRRIGEYVGRAPRFASVEEAEAYMRRVGPGFGELDDQAWREITLSSIRQAGEGWCMRYDPAIGEVMRATVDTMDANLWPLWDRIRCPVLVLRGEHSDLLSSATLAEMTQRGPGARTVVIPDTGHAPMLMKAGEIALVSDFLKAEGA
ncbi:alpha/beta fold hydrolase [Uliginosibacterium paludis]|uniref:Alpha/beta hydrolase n=1 Tax=Uliginosibacterium paludis TaxID=1615952 RepID=A0ABV2CK73_9RHOO